jgi:two-component system phosphate regulon response regulator PhoB
MYFRLRLKRKILIIENDRDIRQIVEYILIEQGFETLNISAPDDLSQLSAFHAAL